MIYYCLVLSHVMLDTGIVWISFDTDLLKTPGLMTCRLTTGSIHLKCKEAHMCNFWGKNVCCHWITLFHNCFLFFFFSFLFCFVLPNLIGNSFRILPEEIATWHHPVMILWNLLTFQKGLDIKWSVHVIATMVLGIVCFDQGGLWMWLQSFKDVVELAILNLF